MPNYRYKCKQCGEFNVNHDMNTKLFTCPKCGREIKRIYSKVNFILAEGDFYSK